ncbi:hypothetical protein F5879DRAFT_974275 [Lentinula edodes]|nr:hypothetical protein F5879DRAFT_974275 [Lentinula edodes]
MLSQALNIQYVGWGELWGSLAGTVYYSPVAGHGFLLHDFELTREMRKEGMVNGVVGGI